MANESTQNDRTEEATPERREEFRERGQVVVSRELTSVAALAGLVVFLSIWLPALVTTTRRIFITHFEQLGTRHLDAPTLLSFAASTWRELLFAMLPVALVGAGTAIVATTLQTRLNWSWTRVKPDFSRLNPITGLARLVDFHMAGELTKSTAKLIAVTTVAYLVIFTELFRAPELMTWPIMAVWRHWGDVTKTFLWSASGILLAIAIIDYIFNFTSIERRLKMTRQEVREEIKRREGDPHVKGRMRRLARDYAFRKTIANTKKATVLITNPTHYSIALKYELGDRAPSVVAKGIDFVALKMRETAREEKIPIIEDRPLARALYAQVKEGQEIPDRFYRAVAEIIRYVFKLKGKRVPGRQTRSPPTMAPPPPPTPLA